AFRLRAMDFARSAGPPWRMRAALDQNVFVFRLSRSSHDVGGQQTFSAASDDRLQTQVGIRDPSRGMVAGGRPGMLVYGPYIALPAGVYQVQVWASEPGGGPEAQMDVAYGQGAKVLVAKSGRAVAGNKPEPMGTLEFEVPASGVTDLEVRVAVGEGSRLAVSHLTLVRLR
ncbi:MAG: hypothetical protein U1A73_09930, partial [Pseudomonas sp.]|nr:hypothetical protein [Pseudomonas sp.]